MIKPLISPLIGWGRGYPPKSAKDPRPEGVSWEIVNLGDVLREADPKVPAETNTEEWLRTSEPYSGFTTVLLNRLYEADPANGCGIRRGGQR